MVRAAFIIAFALLFSSCGIFKKKIKTQDQISIEQKVDDSRVIKTETKVNDDTTIEREIKVDGGVIILSDGSIKADKATIKEQVRKTVETNQRQTDSAKLVVESKEKQKTTTTVTEPVKINWTLIIIIATLLILLYYGFKKIKR